MKHIWNSMPTQERITGAAVAIIIPMMALILALMLPN